MNLNSVFNKNLRVRKKDNMDEKTYHFERLTPINDVNLNVYEC